MAGVEGEQVLQKNAQHRSRILAQSEKAAKACTSDGSQTVKIAQAGWPVADPGSSRAQQEAWIHVRCADRVLGTVAWGDDAFAKGEANSQRNEVKPACLWKSQVTRKPWIDLDHLVEAIAAVELEFDLGGTAPAVLGEEGQHLRHEAKLVRTAANRGDAAADRPSVVLLHGEPSGKAAITRKEQDRGLKILWSSRNEFLDQDAAIARPADADGVVKRLDVVDVVDPASTSHIVGRLDNQR